MAVMPPHSHGHGGGHTGLAHDRRRLGLAALLTGGFMVAEAVGGVVAGSLALLADAGHMLADFASLALAWYAFRIAARPATRKMSYGVDRFQVLAAFVNGMTLIFVCLWITVEAVLRLFEPVEVQSGIMIVVAAIGLAVNACSFLILRGADKHNLNVRGARLHVLGDMLGSLAAVAAGGIIMATGWMTADAILSILIAALIARAGWRVVAESGHILLEGTPDHLDPREIDDDLTRHVDGLIDVHHVHAWSITQSRGIVTLHARAREGAAPDRITTDVKRRLKERFGIAHATVETEFGDCADDHMTAEATAPAS